MKGMKSQPKPSAQWVGDFRKEGLDSDGHVDVMRQWLEENDLSDSVSRRKARERRHANYEVGTNEDC
jgi:hypothetical protein